MLHVICGQRPVPTIKSRVFPIKYSGLPEIIECAKEARVLISNEIKYTTNEKEYLITEVLSGTKANGTMKSGPYNQGCNKPILLNGDIKVLKTCVLNWDRIKYNMCESAFNDFVNIIEALFGIKYQSISVYKAFEMLNEYHQSHLDPDDILNTFFDVYYTNGSKALGKINQPYYETIMNGNTKDQFFHVSGYGDMSATFVNLINSTPEDIITISGKIFLKIDDTILNLIKEYGKPCANILDGGLVNIESIEDLDEFNWDVETSNTQPAQLER
jgi:hypothetical protein